MKKNRVGEIYTTNEGYRIEIVEYFNAENCSIKFDDGNILKNVVFNTVTSGSIKNRNHKSLYNTGYIGYGDYKTSINRKFTKESSSWRAMLQRGYCPKWHDKYPTYIGVK